jgi:hypothetical protein
MTDRPNPLPDPSGTGSYEIRLAGRLDTRWATWFDGLTVSDAADGTTLIAGPVTDRAASMGSSSGCATEPPLVSVTRRDPPPDLPPRSASGRAHRGTM